MRKLIFVSLTLLLLGDATVGLAQETTLSFPKNDPRFTITFASGWKAEITDAGIITAQPMGAAFAVSVFPVEAKNDSAAIEETETEVNKRFQNVSGGGPVEFTTANNIKYLERDYTGTDDGSQRTLAIFAFSPDGQNYYALFRAGTPASDQQFAQDVVAIVKSIKSLRASRDGK